MRRATGTHTVSPRTAARAAAAVNGGGRRSISRVRPLAIDKRRLGAWIVLSAWAVTLFDLHYFLGTMVAAPFGKLATLTFASLLLAIALEAPTVLTTMRPWVWYAPFLMMVLGGVASMVGAVSLGLAKTGLQYLITYYALAVATSIYIRTPRDAMPIIVMMYMRFLWWAIWGRGAGLVFWHPSLQNADGFGGLMVMGVATCFWFALATTSRWQRLLLFALTGYCTVGVVASFARGAFLALLAVAFLIWVRSPRKMLTAAGMIGAAVLVLVAAVMLFGGDAFYREMMSSFEEGNTSGTGGFRWILWGAATKVYLAHPVFGVGISNFGAFAAQYFRPGEIVGMENPAEFWGLNLHSAYFQILSELGTCGVLAFIWCMVDFFIKNRQMRVPHAIARWSALGLDAKLNLKYVSYALEGSLIAVFLGNMVYASFLEPWFITLWAANRLVWALVSPEAESKLAAVPSRMPRVSARVHLPPEPQAAPPLTAQQ